MLLAIVLARQVQLTVVHVQFKIVPPHGVAQKIRSNVGQKWPLENALQGLFAGLFPDGVFLVGIVGVGGSPLSFVGWVLSRTWKKRCGVHRRYFKLISNRKFVTSTVY